ncbi:MAG: anti-sigma F factor [Lachnospiraceae bacterium]|nr:anti-sigma F factor [Lachnospiraceae bacterium]
MRKNEMKLEFDSRSCNESFARVAVAAFLTQLNPTLEEVADVKTAVSEAVTNVIIHAYDREEEKVLVHCWIEEETLWVEVTDHGRGIADVAQAMEPLYTTRQECDRAGMGFAFMDAFMDTLEVVSAPGKGTTVRMSRHITHRNAEGPFDYRNQKVPVAIHME